MSFWVSVLSIFITMPSLLASPNIEQICQSPRIYLIPEFLSDGECDLVIKQALPFLNRSTVLDNKGGKIDSRRTSRGMFFPSNPSQENLRQIEQRIAEITNLPIENGEGLQILHYNVGGEYQPHHDYFTENHQGGKESLQRGGQRVASFLVYLNAPERGGETIFPHAKISVTPKKGDALLFYNVTPDGHNDRMSLHGGAPVLEGEKWLLTKWIREGTFY